MWTPRIFRHAYFSPSQTVYRRLRGLHAFYVYRNTTNELVKVTEIRFSDTLKQPPGLPRADSVYVGVLTKGPLIVKK